MTQFKAVTRNREVILAAINSWVAAGESLGHTPTLIRCWRLSKNRRQAEDEQDSWDNKPWIHLHSSPTLRHKRVSTKTIRLADPTDADSSSKLADREPNAGRYWRTVVTHRRQRERRAHTPSPPVGGATTVTAFVTYTIQMQRLKTILKHLAVKIGPKVGEMNNV